MHLQAQIYLQSQRGIFQTADLKRFCTFNFDTYQAESREAFGNLEVLNEEMLLPESSIEIKSTEKVRIVLLPLVGALEVNTEMEEASYVNSGEVLEYVAEANNGLIITNPYPNETVQYLQIRFKEKTDLLPYSKLTAFDISDKNKLLTITRNHENRILIGQYDGRKEGTFICNLKKAIFAFIIQGAFEVQNRLLEKCDGLSLRNVPEVEFEALSDHAIILIMEVE